MIVIFAQSYGNKKTKRKTAKKKAIKRFE